MDDIASLGGVLCVRRCVEIVLVMVYEGVELKKMDARTGVASTPHNQKK